MINLGCYRLRSKLITLFVAYSLSDVKIPTIDQIAFLGCVLVPQELTRPYSVNLNAPVKTKNDNHGGDG